MPGTAKITFNIEFQSTDIACSIVKNLVIKKVIMLGSKETDIINNADIYDTYKDLYSSEEKRKEKLLQGIQSVNRLKAQVGAKKADGTVITVTTQKNAIKNTSWWKILSTFRFSLFLSILCFFMD